jgi:hypothetical protein
MMKHRLCVPLAALFTLAAVLTATAAGSQPTIVTSTEERIGPLTRTEWFVQAGPSPRATDPAIASAWARRP